MKNRGQPLEPLHSSQLNYRAKIKKVKVGKLIHKQKISQTCAQQSLTSFYDEIKSETWNSKLILKLSVLLKDLNSMVVGVCHHNVLIHAQAESMGGIKLSFAWPELTKLRPYLHGVGLSGSRPDAGRGRNGV